MFCYQSSSCFVQLICFSCVIWQFMGEQASNAGTIFLLIYSKKQLVLPWLPRPLGQYQIIKQSFGKIKVNDNCETKGEKLECLSANSGHCRQLNFICWKLTSNLKNYRHYYHFMYHICFWWFCILPYKMKAIF